MRLDLFPLHTVLFPGVRLPLRIFEQRYLDMISHCRDAELPFGVVLIRDGVEVGGFATPHEVGTVARISRVEALDNGCMNILVVGERRFRIDKLVQMEPHVVGEVVEEAFPIDDPRTVAAVASEVRSAFGEVVALFLELQGGYGVAGPLPRDPEALAYFVGSRLVVGDDARQELLESASVDVLLEAELELVMRQMDDLQSMLESKRDGRRN